MEEIKLNFNLLFPQEIILHCYFLVQILFLLLAVNLNFHSYCLILLGMLPLGSD